MGWPFGGKSDSDRAERAFEEKQARTRQNLPLGSEARRGLVNDFSSNIFSNTANPGLTDEEFRNLINTGVQDLNEGLVGYQGTVRRADLQDAFADPSGIGRQILSDETDRRREAGQEQVASTFTGEGFDLDQDIIDSIVGERQGAAREQVGNLLSRGSFNALGGRTANEVLGAQAPGAAERVQGIGETIVGGVQSERDALREQASAQAQGFQLGDDPFDITPFAEARQGLATGLEESLGPDVRAAIEGEPLFNVSEALQSGGRAQGLVSGAPQASILDTLADRERGQVSSSKNKRNIGASSGGGIF